MCRCCCDVTLVLVLLHVLSSFSVIVVFYLCVMRHGLMLPWCAV